MAAAGVRVPEHTQRLGPVRSQRAWLPRYARERLVGYLFKVLPLSRSQDVVGVRHVSLAPGLVSTLCQEAGEQAPGPLTKADAAKRIHELHQRAPYCYQHSHLCDAQTDHDYRMTNRAIKIRN